MNHPLKPLWLVSLKAFPHSPLSKSKQDAGGSLDVSSGGLLAVALLLRSREAKLRRELELMASTELLSAAAGRGERRVWSLGQLGWPVKVATRADRRVFVALAFFPLTDRASILGIPSFDPRASN